MSAPVRLPLRQGSPAWLEARRSLVTSTAIPVLLGISPYKCEADLADEMLGLAEPQEPSVRMRIGSLVQDLIGDEYSRVTGRRVQPVRDLWVHPELPWAAASPDFRVVGEKRLVEAKRTSSRTRFADGIPQDVEAQVVWALGVSRYPVSDVAVLLGDDALLEPVPEVRHSERLFADFVAIAEDFRRRLAVGGPFARDAARIKRDHPADDGTDMTADAELSDAVLQLLALRAQRADVEKAEEAIETAVKARMGDHARLVGPGFAVTWKRSRDATATDWKSLADGLLRQLPEAQRETLVSVHSSVRPGFRPFRVTAIHEDD